MIRYRARLESDLGRWQTAGWVTPAGADAIRADVASRRTGVGLSSALGILAAVLLGCAAMSFVAANWQEMSKLFRLMVLGGGLIASTATAIWLDAKGMRGLSEAAILAGIAVFGAAIMLIAQMYHMDGNPPDALWLWGVGALVPGVLLRSKPAIAAAIVLFAGWSGYETSLINGVHWSYLPVWLATAAAVAVSRWRAGKHLAAIALAGWIVSVGFVVGTRLQPTGLWIVAGTGVALAAAAIAFGSVIDRWRPVSATMLGYGMAIAFAGLFALQFLASPSGRMLVALGATTLGLLIGALVWGWRTDNRPALWIAYVAFSTEIFALYVRKLGTLMNTSAFFLVAGLMVAALAAVAMRLHRVPHHGAAA